MTISHGLRRRFQKSFYLIYSWGILWLLVALLSGCAGAPYVKHSQQRGLFQVFQSKNHGIDSNVLPRSGPFQVPASRAPSSEGFVWPLPKGSISSYFGPRHNKFHDGIDIGIAQGTPIFASREGRVIYSGNKIRGYGNLVIVRHKGQLATIYAHNRKNFVRKGDRVRQGQLIGLVGSTGHATGPHLHFEVRHNEVPQDPLAYLPGYRAPAMARQ